MSDVSNVTKQERDHGLDLAIQVMESHCEGGTASHMHWLSRECAKLIHGDAQVSSREDALKNKHFTDRRSGKKGVPQR